MIENPLLDRLDVRTFSGGQVQKAIGLTAASVNRLCNAYRLELFSPESTQGKSREYCLADVQQLALAVELNRTVARPKRVAASLNVLVGFLGSVTTRVGEDDDKSMQYRLSDMEENRTLRAAARKSIRALPEFYWAEDRPIFIHIAPGFAFQNVIDEPEPKLRDGILLNATRYLSLIRLQLAETVTG